MHSEVDEADEPDEPEMVAATAARSLPSTRAGGQDDVSSNSNSLKPNQFHAAMGWPLP